MEARGEKAGKRFSAVQLSCRSSSLESQRQNLEIWRSSPRQKKEKRTRRSEKSTTSTSHCSGNRRVGQLRKREEARLAAMACDRVPLMRRILSLLESSSRIEDSVGAVLLVDRLCCMQFCGECAHLSEESILSQVSRFIQPALIIRMLKMTKNADIAAGGASFLCRTCLVPELSVLWPPLLPQIVACIANQSEASTRNKLFAAVKHISSVNGAICRDQAVKAILDLPSTTFPLELLQCIGGLGSIDPDQKITLSSESALMLQSLVIQCLHGLAKEHIRLECLAVCDDLLDSASAFHPSWTCATAPSSSSSLLTMPSPESSLRGSFPATMVSITVGELHLRTEEVAFFLGQFREQRRSDSSAPPPQSILTERVFEQWTRALQATTVCCDLLQHMLGLLIGTEEDEAGLWAELPADTILAIKRHFEACQRDVVGLLSDCGQGGAGSVDAASVEHSRQFQCCLRVCTQLVIALSREDECLRDVFLDKLAALATWVVLPLDAPDVLPLQESNAEVFSYLWSLAEEQLSQMHENPDRPWHQSDVLDRLLSCNAKLLLALSHYVREWTAGKVTTDCLSAVEKAVHDGLRYLVAVLELVRQPLQSLLRSEGEKALFEILHCQPNQLRELHRELRALIASSVVGGDCWEVAQCLVSEIELLAEEDMLVAG